MTPATRANPPVLPFWRSSPVPVNRYLRVETVLHGGIGRTGPYPSPGTMEWTEGAGRHDLPGPRGGFSGPDRRRREDRGRRLDARRISPGRAEVHRDAR